MHRIVIGNHLKVRTLLWVFTSWPLYLTFHWLSITILKCFLKIDGGVNRCMWFSFSDRIVTSLITASESGNILLTCPSPTLCVSMMVTTPGLWGLRRFALWGVPSSSGVPAGRVPASCVTTFPTMVRPVFKVWGDKRWLNTIMRDYFTITLYFVSCSMCMWYAAVCRLLGLKPVQERVAKCMCVCVCMCGCTRLEGVHSMPVDKL